MATIKTFGPVDERSLAQLERCAEGAPFAVLCADHHPGYAQPIGGAVAYEDRISPSGVGYDIACGNKAARTDLLADDVDVPRMMDEIVRQISFGVGRTNEERVDHPVIERIAHASFEPQRALLDLARKQLGTVGSGNHYIDLFADDEGYLWVGVHFGSRRFGHKTASGFLALARGAAFGDRVKEGGMDAPPTLFPVDSELGQSYLAAMELAGDYAYAGRDWVVDKVLSILGARATEEVHNHHNFAWRESHFGRDVYVIRKGCTPIHPGQRSFVGGSMGDVSVILEGIDTDEAKDALYSTVHGAGRVMSRTQAAGKWRHVRDARGRKRRVRDASTAAIDWRAVQDDLRARGIVIRGGGADEAPGVYKRLEEVLGYHSGSIRIVHTLRPLGVAMAGEDVFDPYKD